MRVLGIVTARGGSKGIPRKNIAPLLGRPLLAYTAEAALGSRKLSRVVLSTEDEEIARVGREWGLETPFPRPAELARDDTPTIPVLQDVVRRLEAAGERHEAVMTLQPTSPLRRAEDIDGAIGLMEQTGADSVISFVDVGERHPARMKYIGADGWIAEPPFAEVFEGQPRQALPKMYLREGSIYLTRRDVLMEQDSLKGRRSMAWMVPPERACNIDSPLDLFFAEQLLLRRDGPGGWPLARARGSEARGPAPSKILISESRGFSRAALELLRAISDVVAADLDREGLLRSLGDAEALWVRLRHRVDREVMDAAPHLRWILSATTGLDHIDLRAAAERGIEIVSLQGETGFLRGVHATAEHTLALMLAGMRRIPAAAAHARAGRWDRDLFRGRELHGKTVGIVGFGRLGQMVAPLVAAFGARVLISDPGAGRGVALDLLLRESDVVTLHVALTPETRGLIGAREFAGMKTGAWLVNTSRGELIDESSLLEALRSGRLAGAALDVLSGESGAGNPQHVLVHYARRHHNLLLTPHIGGCTVESMEKTETFLAEKFAGIFQHMAVLHVHG